MRTLVTALLVLLPGFAAAQPAQPPAGGSPGTLPPIGLPLAPIGLPLAPLGLSSGPTATQAAPARTPKRPSSDGAKRPHGRGGSPGFVYVVPTYGAYGWGVAAGATTPGASTPSGPAAEAAPDGTPSRRSEGVLQLDLRPRPTGQLFLDGVYVGTLAELGHDLTLPEGTHQLEIRQAGFKRFTLAVRIDAGRTLVYQGELERADPPPSSTIGAAGAAPSATPAPMAPVVRKPLYFIPGCYLGDVPPTEAGLPASCDPSRAVVYRP